MGDQMINVVQPRHEPSGIPFHPTDANICKYLNDINQGAINPWGNYVIRDVNILQYQPWNLPDMDKENNEAYYLSKREKRAKNPDGKQMRRQIGGNNDSCWLGRGGKAVMAGRLKKRSFRHRLMGRSTGWLMKEYVLQDSDKLALCKIYKRVEKNQGHGDCGGSRSEPNQMRQSSAPSSSSTAAQHTPKTNPGVHSHPNMSDQCQSFAPTELSFSAVHNIDPEKLDDERLFEIANHYLGDEDLYE